MERAVKRKLLLLAGVFVGVIIALSLTYAIQNKKPDLDNSVLTQPRSDLPTSTIKVYNLDALGRSLQFSNDDSNRVKFALENYLSQKEPNADYTEINLSSVQSRGPVHTFSTTSNTKRTVVIEVENGVVTEIKDSVTGESLFVPPAD